MTDFKTKMAELAAKYNISHKRDIDWHNFVYEVEQLFRPELKESEDERIIKFLKHAATLDAADELFQEYGVKHTQVIAWLESQKAAKPKVMQEVSDNVDKLRAISTPADEDWFKIAEEWEKEDKHDHASDH